MNFDTLIGNYTCVSYQVRKIMSSEKRLSKNKWMKFMLIKFRYVLALIVIIRVHLTLVEKYKMIVSVHLLYDFNNWQAAHYIQHKGKCIPTFDWHNIRV